MVDHDLLHKELAQLAALTTGEFDLHEGLHQLSVTASAALALDGAGVTLHMLDGDTEYISATDAVTMHVEQQQDALQEGAGVDAIATSQIMAVGDLKQETRWPHYRPEVLRAGFHAVAGVPIPFQGRSVGALNLYANESRAWTTDDFAAARLVAELAAGYLINTHLLGKTETLAAQLREALDTRIIIEQGKGLLAGRHGITPDAAFEVMRNFARSSRTKIHDVARSVVSGDGNVLGDTRAGSADHTT